MSQWRKLVRLVRLLPERPHEFLDRVRVMVQARIGAASTARYVHGSWSDGISEIAQQLRTTTDLLSAPSLLALTAEVQEALAHIPSASAFDSRHNGDFALAHLCYLVCRATRPNIVVETGVAHGVSSTFILAALEENERGVLHSVDLPPLHEDARALVGAVIPTRLRGRWRLHFGSSKRVLPGVLAEARHVDVFIHDSLHTSSHMRWEYRTAAQYLSPGGILVFDDIEGNAVWRDEIASAVSFQRVLPQRSKASLCGLAVK